jgi:hypothetical protein
MSFRSFGQLRTEIPQRQSRALSPADDLGRAQECLSCPVWCNHVPVQRRDPQDVQSARLIVFWTSSIVKQPLRRSVFLTGS